MDETTGTEQDRLALERLIRGFQISRMLRVAADLRLADRIPSAQPRTVVELADACGVRALPLARLLRALASVGVFRMSAAGDVSHSPMSHLLRTDAPHSLHYAARFWTARGSWRAWEDLDAALVDEVPHERAWNAGRFEYLRLHPDEARVFDEFMARFPDHRHQAVADAYDFSSATLVVDIGGGNGEALRRILGRDPQARGLVFDRADVVARIPESARMDGRIRVEGGDLLERVPAGGDIYVIMRVLHDFADADCRRILRNCRAAMGRQARILICEQLLDPDPAHGDAASYLVDMQMMAMFGSGRERSEPEFRDLLRDSGLALQRVIATASPVCIVEAAPA